MIGLTQQQADLLVYLKRYMAEAGGVAPSYDEMRVAVGLVSKSGISRLIVGLEERGFIRRLAGRARAIEIIGDTPDLTAVPVYALIAELARRGLHFSLSDDTTAPGSALPEPPPSPPSVGGSGPSDFCSFHTPEIARA